MTVTHRSLRLFSVATATLALTTAFVVDAIKQDAAYASQRALAVGCNAAIAGHDCADLGFLGRGKQPLSMTAGFGRLP